MIGAEAGIDVDFVLPPELEAGEPAEARGLARDEVRLLVSWRDDDRIVHARFRDLGQFLERGDVLVVNTSATLKASLPAVSGDGRALELHLSTRLPGDLWVIELREPDGIGSRPFRDATAGDTMALAGGGTARLLVPYPHDVQGDTPAATRLWCAAIRVPAPLFEYLDVYGEPIRYGYARRRWPIEMYQTVFATEPGSAEMPSAARPFTPDLVTRLVARGVQFAPVLLHTGVASLEEHEPPYEEYYRVEPSSAAILNAARDAGRRVVAVGTTTMRAVETVTDRARVTHPGEGWTRLVISPDRRPRGVDALLTGLHEPRATHMAMLEALTAPRWEGALSCRHGALGMARACVACGGRAQVQRAYAEALRERYLWHEFGDTHLMLSGEGHGV
jgi:S-adenosylmethionine:tRNA ribosyltransferase-isomerase